jgi:hypothetical protein
MDVPLHWTYWNNQGGKQQFHKRAHLISHNAVNINNQKVLDKEGRVTEP